ncbi:hypothetical protein COOONC_10798 [Cooperia oncophora]
MNGTETVGNDVSMERNSSEPDGVDIPRFNVTLSLGFLKVLRLDWDDERLVWDPAEHCGIKYIHVPSSEVWIPEVTVTQA